MSESSVGDPVALGCFRLLFVMKMETKRFCRHKFHFHSPIPFSEPGHSQRHALLARCTYTGRCYWTRCVPYIYTYTGAKALRPGQKATGSATKPAESCRFCCGAAPDGCRHLWRCCTFPDAGKCLFCQRAQRQTTLVWDCSRITGAYRLQRRLED